MKNLLTRFKLWLIKKLGGYSDQEYQSERDQRIKSESKVLDLETTLNAALEKSGYLEKKLIEYEKERIGGYIYEPPTILGKRMKTDMFYSSVLLSPQYPPEVAEDMVLHKLFNNIIPMLTPYVSIDKEYDPYTQADKYRMCISVNDIHDFLSDSSWR